MPIRKEELTIGEYYHVFNKSIAGFKIFNSDADYSRMVEALRFYQRENPPLAFSRFVKMDDVARAGSDMVEEWSSRDKLVRIYAYCIMPTHIHLLLKQEKADGISIFVGNTLNSFSRYFNTKLKRKGPLWEHRFKNALIKTDEQFLHLTRYLHLNPVTAYMVSKPEEWLASSYREYVLEDELQCGICEYDDVIKMRPIVYREFVEDNISYQRELAGIKRLILE